MAILTKDNNVGLAEVKEVQKWQTRIQIGKNFRDAEGRKDSWRNLKNAYRNFFKDEVISVPLLFSHGRQMVPFLYFKNPSVECTPLQRGFERKAKLLEAVDNMLLREMRVKEQLKLIIQDAYLYDYGIRKVGYDSEFGYDATGTLWKELFAELGMELSEEEAKEYNTYVIREFPFFLRVPPRRFVVDPDVEGPTLDTARYCIEEFFRPLQDVLDDDRYDVPKDLKATHMLGKDSQGNSVISPKTMGYGRSDPKVGMKSDVERLRMWEIWDKETLERMVLADGHNGYLLKTEDVWNLDTFFPYDRLCFNPVSDEHYSTSDAQYIEKMQYEYNDSRSQEMLHRRKENTKWMAKRNVLKPEEKAKFQQGKPGILVELDGVPGQDLVPVTSTMSGDIYRVAADIRNDMMETLATGKNQLSQEMGKRKTAHEAMLIDQYTQIRGDERRDIVADFLGRSIIDINKLVFKFWDAPDIIKIVGPEGEAWLEWTGEDLEGKYAIQVQPASTMPHNKEQWKQTVEKLYQMLAGNPFVDLREMTKILLDSYEEFDTNRVLMQMPGMRPSMADFRPGKAKMQDEGAPGESMGPGAPPQSPGEAAGTQVLPTGGPGQPEGVMP